MYFCAIAIFVVFVFFLHRYQKSTNSYAPYNKDWIKEKIYVLLRRQAARSQWVVDGMPWSVSPVIWSLCKLFFCCFTALMANISASKWPQCISLSCQHFIVYYLNAWWEVLWRGLRLFQWHRSVPCVARTGIIWQMGYVT